MARRGKQVSWRLRLLALLVLVLAGGAAWAWWEMRHWTPEQGEFSDQGVRIVAGAIQTDFNMLGALGASFAYVDASDGSEGGTGAAGKNFAARLKAARKAGLQVGAVHSYNPCVMADGQSANFVRLVPRDAALLPPAIELSRLADECEERVSDAAVESELMTLINQIENHAGKPVILKIDEAFEDRYGLARSIERNLWLTRTRFAPEYAGRPWLMWTANEELHNAASDEPIEWVVVRP